ncbi:MAG: response regulator [Cyanobacteria bacterium J06642_11]
MLTALIVEDSRTDRERLTYFLQASGVAVVEAISSEDALHKLQNRLPDMVFVDVVLPGQSGFEFCHSLKTNLLTQRIPVVICSMKATEADKLWGTMLGADDYLSKPVDPQQLGATLEKVMG